MNNFRVCVILKTEKRGRFRRNREEAVVWRKRLSLSVVAQKKAIEEAAKRGSCVFIGRCADYILRSRPDVLRVFVYADRDIRLRRAIDEYGDLEEHIDEFMHQTDKRRRIYYENYTNQRWGDRENYDLMLNSGGEVRDNETITILSKNNRSSFAR